MEILDRFPLGFSEQILAFIAISQNEWVLRTINTILHIKDGELVRKILINDFGEIVTTFWGGDYSFGVIKNKAILIGLDNCYSWSLKDYSFQKFTVKNTLKTDAEVRPFSKASSHGDIIHVPLQNIVANEAPYFAQLKFTGEGDIRWSQNSPSHLYAIEFKEWNGPQGLPDLSDSMLNEGKLNVFTTGQHKAYTKYGMDFSIFTMVDSDGHCTADQITFNNCFGNFSSDKKWIILTPLYKKSVSKGKQLLYNIASNQSVMIDLPKEVKGYRIIDVYQNAIITANDYNGLAYTLKAPYDKDLEVVSIGLLK